jgi:hypothetical protein
MKKDKLGLLKKLEDEFKSRCVKVIYDILKSDGGLCRAQNRYYLILNKNLSIDQKIALMTKYLNDLNKN